MLAVGMAAVMLTCSTPSMTIKADTKSDIEAKKQEAEKNQKAEQQALADLRTTKSNLEAAVKTLDTQIVSLSNTIDQLAQEITALEQEITQTEADLVQAKATEQIQYANMQKRIQFLYENGNMDYLEALLSAGSMDSILNRSEYVTEISKYDYNMLMQLVAIRQDIANKEQLLQQDKEAAETKKQESEQQKASLEEKQKAKEQAIKDTQSDIDDTLENIDKYERECAKYDAQLDEIERQALAAAQAAQANGGSAPTYSGGKLGWPVPASHRISSGFGPRNTGIKGASRSHKGIDIPVASGSSVVAAEAGTVIAVDYNSARGYYVMVNHGGGLTTLYQHNTKITVSVGQQVAKGEEVAKSGSTGISSGPHCHFEVRVNGTPVNPLSYVK